MGIGGFIGTVSRYYSQIFISKVIPSTLPYGTFAINVLGCFLIGVIYAFSERGNILSPEWRLFLATGICGGFTTFSTFSFESINLIRGGEFFALSAYVIGSVVLGFAATWLGMLLIKSI